MRRYLLILFVISNLFGAKFLKKSIIYLDIMMTNKIDGDLTIVDLSNALPPSYSFTDEFSSNCVSLGWEFPVIDKEDKYKLLIGISYSIIPLEKNNILFYPINGGGPIYPKDNNFPITSAYLKAALPVDGKLEVWTHLGYSFIEPQDEYYTYVDGASVLPIRYLKFDSGYSYGLGIDYKLNNGMYAGFNFIYDIYDFTALIQTSANQYDASVSGNFDILRRSIRIGYSF